MRLCGTGWLDWAEFEPLVGGWEAVWADLSGPHLSGVPARAPETTHIWAWSNDCWVRARVDEGDVVAGFLHPAGECPRGGQDCPDAIVGQVRQSESWGEGHINVGNLRDQRWEIVEAMAGVAAMFVRAAHADDSVVG